MPPFGTGAVVGDPHWAFWTVATNCSELYVVLPASVALQLPSPTTVTGVPVQFELV
jgi:hypothetical protein